VQTFDNQTRVIRKTHRVIRRIGLQLIADKMRDVTEEKASAGGTDLLSLMIKSNMSTTTQPEQRLSVDQILNQIPTFLGAGKYHLVILNNQFS
jgi:cytochrome P450